MKGFAHKRTQWDFRWFRRNRAFKKNINGRKQVCVAAIERAHVKKKRRALHINVQSGIFAGLGEIELKQNYTWKKASLCRCD